MTQADLGPRNASSHVDVDLARPTFNGLTSALHFLDCGRTDAAEISLDGAERWARASRITLQTAEEAAGGPPEQTGFVVTSEELREIHLQVKEAHELILCGRVRASMEATLNAWRRAKVATECLEAAASINAVGGHANVLH
ncbi:hypothetical protein ACIPR8_11215 [Stenotrophomonas sp. LARHCG68]